MSDCNIDTSCLGGLFSEFQIKLFDDIEMFVGKFWSAFFPCIFYVLFQEIVRNKRSCIDSFH